jgi:hypothetical protein
MTCGGLQYLQRKWASSISHLAHGSERHGTSITSLFWASEGNAIIFAYNFGRLSASFTKRKRNLYKIGSCGLLLGRIKARHDAI